MYVCGYLICSYPNVGIVVYTGDTDATPDDIIATAERRFQVRLHQPVHFVYLQSRFLLEAKWVDSFCFNSLEIKIFMLCCLVEFLFELNMIIFILKVLSRMYSIDAESGIRAGRYWGSPQIHTWCLYWHYGLCFHITGVQIIRYVFISKLLCSLEAIAIIANCSILNFTSSPQAVARQRHMCIIQRSAQICCVQSIHSVPEWQTDRGSPEVAFSVDWN